MEAIGSIAPQALVEKSHSDDTDKPTASTPVPSIKSLAESSLEPKSTEKPVAKGPIIYGFRYLDHRGDLIKIFESSQPFDELKISGETTQATTRTVSQVLPLSHTAWRPRGPPRPPPMPTHY